MSTLVDQFGQPVSFSRFLDGAEQSNTRPAWATRAEGIRRAVSVYDWRTVVSASRRLFGNMGIPKGAIQQRATYSTVGGWTPVFLGKDKTWGEMATAWLTEQFYPCCEVRGGAFDFVTTLKIDSETIDHSGGFGVLLTTSADGFPQTQRIPIHRFGSRYDTLEVILSEGAYAGCKMHQGIIYNAKGRPVAYRIYEDPVNLDAPSGDFQDISARDLIHVYDPEWYDQGHGFPAFTPVLNDLRDMKQSKEWEQLAMLQSSAIGLVEHNETGAEDPNDPAILQNTDSATTSGIQTQTLEGGTIRYFKANSGAKLDYYAPNRPNDEWDRFNDRLARGALLALPWPFSLVWKSEGGGTDKRADIEQARSSIKERQAVIRPYARRIVQYAISKAMVPVSEGGIGALPFNADWWRWAHAMPPLMGIDDGRNNKQRLDDLKYGTVTLEEDQAQRGKNWIDTRTQQEREVNDLLERAERIAQQNSIPLDLSLNLLQQSSPNPNMATQSGNAGKNEDTE